MDAPKDSQILQVSLAMELLGVMEAQACQELEEPSVSVS